MGFILSKFRKAKPSAKDTLENIDKELKGIQRFQVDTELQQKRIIGQLILFSSLAYLVFAVGVYLLAPSGLKWNEQLIYIIPFVIFPFIVWAIRQLINWWYQRKIKRNKEKSENLKKERQQLLDDVMENETFKVAKEILEKYAPVHLLPKYLADQRMSPVSAAPISRTPTPGSFQDGLRRRSMNVSSTPMTGMTPRMIRPSYGPMQGQLMRRPSNSAMLPAIMPAPSSGGHQYMTYRYGFRVPRMGGPMPSYMLPMPPTNPMLINRKTGWMDKLVDYVIGDGAANRYALICRYCATHNGLAPEEDFPYIGYKCISCRQYNPPRKVRPTGPTLPKNTVVIEEMEDSANKTQDRSITAGSETDAESEPKTTSENVTEEVNETSENESEQNPVVELGSSSAEGSIKSESDTELPNKIEFNPESSENENVENEENTSSEAVKMTELSQADQEVLQTDNTEEANQVDP